MDQFCTNLMSFILGLFTFMFFCGWNMERNDRYDSIKVDKKKGTCIEWEFIQQEVFYKNELKKEIKGKNRLAQARIKQDYINANKISYKPKFGGT